jgi:hypothetical protein
MQIVTVTYDSGVLHVKCAGEFGVGSAGNSSAERIVRTIQRWMSRRAEPVSEIEIDYTDVTYVWGDGPVSSMIPFFSQGVVKCRVIASPQNWEPLKTLLSSCRVPFFELTEAAAEPRLFSTLRLELDTVPVADEPPRLK